MERYEVVRLNAKKHFILGVLKGSGGHGNHRCASWGGNCYFTLKQPLSHTAAEQDGKYRVTQTGEVFLLVTWPDDRQSPKWFWSSIFYFTFFSFFQATIVVVLKKTTNQSNGQSHVIYWALISQQVHKICPADRICWYKYGIYSLISV